MTTPYKPMKYVPRLLHPAQVLCLGKYKKYDFLAVNMGTHPTAYVRIPSTHKFYEKHYDFINPQPKAFRAGPFTFSRPSSEFASHLDIQIPNGWYLGWDYAHIGDYICTPFTHNSNDARKYTTEDIIADCKYIINYLLENKDVARNRQQTKEPSI